MEKNTGKSFNKREYFEKKGELEKEVELGHQYPEVKVYFERFLRILLY